MIKDLFLPPEIIAKIDLYLDNNQLLSAIKVYNDFTKAGLKNSFVIINDYKLKRDMSFRSSGENKSDREAINAEEIENLFLEDEKKLSKNTKTEITGNITRGTKTDYTTNKQNKDFVFYEDKSNSLFRLVLLLVFCLFLGYVVFKLFF